MYKRPKYRLSLELALLILSVVVLVTHTLLVIPISNEDSSLYAGLLVEVICCFDIYLLVLLFRGYRGMTGGNTSSPLQQGIALFKRAIRSASIKLSLLILSGLVLVGLLFGVGQPLVYGVAIDAERFSQYGSFVGGLLSAWSIYLVVQTLREQRKSSEESQINSVFWGMLEHLQKEIANLSVYEEKTSIDFPEQTQRNHCTNKDYFDALCRELQEDFETPDQKKLHQYNVTLASESYQRLYVRNPRLGSYFRLLYRICEFVDKSMLTEDKKRDYIKLLRAQLTRSELLLLRYNAQTPEGENFQKYINKYNLLKHLHIFELLEFKRWWSDNMTDLQRYQESYSVASLKKALKSFLDDEEEEVRSKPHNREVWGYWFSWIGRDRSRMRIYIEEQGDPSHYRMSRALLTCILFEIFYFSSFQCIWKYGDIEFEKDPDLSDFIPAWIISTKDGRRLTLSEAEEEAS